MAIAIDQMTVTTSAAQVALVPPGSTIVLSNADATADIYIGLSSSVTTTSGAPLDAGGPTTLVNPPGAEAFTLWAIAGTGTHVMGWVLITGQ